MDTDKLNLNLSLHQSYPPSIPTIFSFSYCPKKFRNAQALGGHQNQHKLQCNLGKRNQEVALAKSQGKDENSGVKVGIFTLLNLAIMVFHEERSMVKRFDEYCRGQVLQQ